MEFDINFTVSQNLQAFRRKLHLIKAILDGALRIVSTLSSLAEEIKAPSKVSPEIHSSFLHELDNISRDLRSQCSTTDELLSLSSDMKMTVRFGVDPFVSCGSSDCAWLSRPNRRYIRFWSSRISMLSTTTRTSFVDSQSKQQWTLFRWLKLPSSMPRIRAPCASPLL